MNDLNALRHMLQARSVAVVGASERGGSAGAEMMRQLEIGGFQGNIAPVNPKYTSVAGRDCFRSLADVPFDVDLALLGVPGSALEEQLILAAKVGISSVVIFASGYDATDLALADRLRRVALENELTVCGGNCMGFVNFEHGLRALAFEEPADLQPGPIAWITHSGSAFSALLHNTRGLRFSLAVSAGQEFTTTIADYLAFALEMTNTRAVALFLETVRDPQGFLAALGRAGELDVPVVALKVGTQRTSRDLIAAHSGALAGDDGAYEAIFDHYGVLRVRTLGEMVDTLELLVAGRRAREGGLATVHDSGGERAHLIDIAAEAGVRFASISATTRSQLEQTLEPGLPAVNPLDAWGTGNDFETIFLDCLRTLAEDPDTGALALVVDLAGEDLETGYAHLAESFFSQSQIPFAVLCNLASAVDSNASSRLRALGIPVLEDTATGLAAFRHLFALRDWRNRPPIDMPRPTNADVRERWRQRLGRGGPIAQDEGLRLLSDYGIPTAATMSAFDTEGVLAAAAQLGYPVALKTAAESIAHKSDVEGVQTGIDNDNELLAAYRSLTGKLGPHVLVQRMAPAGVEVAFGIVGDAQFGPLVLAAAGGVLIEAFNDRRLALPPLDENRARRLLDGLALCSLLEGYRGSAGADISSLIQGLVRLSMLAIDVGDLIEAIDVNPVVAGPDGCVAVDCLVLPRGAKSSR